MSEDKYSVDEILKEVAMMRNNPTSAKPRANVEKSENFAKPQSKIYTKPIENVEKNEPEAKEKVEEKSVQEGNSKTQPARPRSFKVDASVVGAGSTRRRFNVGIVGEEPKSNNQEADKDSDELLHRMARSQADKIAEEAKRSAIEKNKNTHQEKVEKQPVESDIDKTMVFTPIKKEDIEKQKEKAENIANELDKQLNNEEIGEIFENPKKKKSKANDFQEPINNDFVIGEGKGKHKPEHKLSREDVENMDGSSPLKLRINGDAIDLSRPKSEDDGAVTVKERETDTFSQPNGENDEEHFEKMYQNDEKDEIINNNDYDDDYYDDIDDEYDDDNGFDVQSILEGTQDERNKIEEKTTRPVRQMKIDYSQTYDSEEDIDDYKTIEDAEPVKRELDQKRAKISRKQLVTDIMFVLSVIITVLPSFTSALSIVSPYENTFNFLVANIVVLGIAIIANFGSIVKGFLNIFRLRADINTAMGISAIAVTIQSVLGFFSITDISKYHIPFFSAVAIFSMCFNLRGKKSMLTRIRDNFRLIATSTVKQSCFVADEDFCESLESQGFIGTPSVACSKSVLNLRNYLENSFCEDPSDSISRTLAPIGFLAFLATVLITYRGTNNIMLAISYGASVAAISSPITSLLCTNTPLKAVCKKMRERGGVISGYNAVEEFSDVDCIAIDADELFPAGSVELISLRAMGDVSIEDVILQSASVTINAGGPLADVFDKIIDGRRKMLPKVTDIQYEDNLGLSGKIDGKLVRVGNRNLMDKHAIVGLPEQKIDDKAAQNDSFIVYASIDNRVCGLFIVKYTCTDVDIDECVYDTVRNGISIAVKTNDPNITPELIAKVYDIPSEYVVVLPSHLAYHYDEMTNPAQNGSACLSHNNSVLAYTKMVLACKSLKIKTIIAVIMQTLFVLFGFGIAMFMSVTGDLFARVTPLNIMIYQAIGAVLIMGICAVVKRIK